MKRGTMRGWVVIVAAVGLVATLAASGLFWLMLTQPVAAAGLFGKGL